MLPIQLIVSLVCLALASVPFIMLRTALKNKRRLNNVMTQSKGKTKAFYTVWVSSNAVSTVSLLGAAIAIWMNFLWFVGLVALPICLTTALLRRDEMRAMSKFGA